MIMMMTIMVVVVMVVVVGVVVVVVVVMMTKTLILELVTDLFTISQCQEGVCSLTGLRNQNANIVPEKDGGCSARRDRIIDHVANEREKIQLQ